MQVDPIDQRPGDPTDVALLLALARLADGAVPAMGRVHRRHQQHPRGKRGRAVGPGDGHHTVLERLAKALEHATGELRQFVQKEHTVVGEAHLAGPRHPSAADDRRGRGGVVRTADRTRAHERAAFAEQTRTTVDSGDLEGFGPGHRRKQARQRPSHHRLAGSRGTDQKQVVPARRGDRHRPLRRLLPADLAAVDRGAASGEQSIRIDLRSRRRHAALQEGDHLVETLEPVHVDPPDRRRLDGVGPGQDDAGATEAPREGGQADRPPNRTQSSVEGEFTGEEVRRHHRTRRGERSVGKQQRDRDGQVEDRSLLAKVARGEADRGLLPRVAVAAVPDCGPHPVDRLANRGVGQSDHRRARQAAGAEVDLDLAGDRIDPLQDEALDTAPGDARRLVGMHAANLRPEVHASGAAAETPRRPGRGPDPRAIRRDWSQCPG